jgi:hypothetical protein
MNLSPSTASLMFQIVSLAPDRRSFVPSKIQTSQSAEPGVASSAVIAEIAGMPPLGLLAISANVASSSVSGMPSIDDCFSPLPARIRASRSASPPPALIVRAEIGRPGSCFGVETP